MRGLRRPPTGLGIARFSRQTLCRPATRATSDLRFVGKRGRPCRIVPRGECRVSPTFPIPIPIPIPIWMKP